MTRPDEQATDSHEDDGATVVVDHLAAAESTVMVDRGVLTDATIIAESPAHDIEGTIVVDRSAQTDIDGTIVVSRGSSHGLDDGTVVVERGSEAPDDGTLVVSRDALGAAADASALSPAAPAPAPRKLSRRPGKRRVTLPPVEPGFGRDAVDAVGPGAVAAYEPRPVVAAPMPDATVAPGETSSRQARPELPSVSRRSRRGGVAALAGFGIACVVSVGGLTAIAIALFGG